MGHRVFLGFIWPSLLAMLLFGALPILSVVTQSLYVEHEKVLKVVESCGPFGCEQKNIVDSDAMADLQKDQRLGRYNGLGTYLNRSHLAVDEVLDFWQSSENFSSFFSELHNLPFYKALFFTLMYTFLVTPLVLLLGLMVALSVNQVSIHMKGIVIFLSLLPMIVTPLIGSLVLFWMFDAEGVVGSTLQYLFSDSDLSLKSSPTLTWLTLFVYGVWHSAPFAFVVLYAGLQTVPRDTLESSMMDGANRWQQVRYVIFPHLLPLVSFVMLMQLMDNFRVFEPIVGFNASASATSLSWMIYNDLNGEHKLFGSAATTSVLTILGVVVLLLPVLIRTWRDQRLQTR